MPLLRVDEEQAVRELFARLERDVELVLVLGPQQTPLAGAGDIDFSAEAREVLEAVAGLGERVSLRVAELPELEVERFPAVCVLADGEDTRIRYYGLPWGYEVASIVGAVLEAGRAESSLAPETLERLEALEHDITLEVFVTPTCPHCPPAVLLAYRAALASPRVRAAAIESTEFPALAEQHGVYAVPAIVIDGEHRYDGAVPEPVFVERLLAAAGS
jgi:glutaredoxin-like protein